MGSRLLAGGFSDPLVGRDVAIGCAAGALMATLSCVAILLPTWVGRPAESLMFTPPVLDVPDIIQGAAFGGALAVFQGLALLFLLFIGRLALRRQALAVIGVVLLLTAPTLADAVNPVLVGASFLAFTVVVVVTLARVGLLAVIVACFNMELLEAAPSILPFAAWHSGLGAAMIGIVAALALYGFYRSLAGRPAFGALAADA